MTMRASLHTLRRILSKRHQAGPELRYGMAVCFVVLAAIFSFALRESVGHRPVFQTPFFFCAIAVASWFGGFGPGFLASLLSVLLVGYHANLPDWGFTLQDLPRFVFFFLTGLFISWLGERQRVDETALRRAQEGLERKVQDRTTDLQQAHTLLTREFAERLQAEQRLQLLHRLSRTTGLGVLTESILQEIRQPLAALLPNANACLRALSGDRPDLAWARAEAQRAVRECQQAASVLARIEGLLAKAPAGRRRRSVNDVVREMIPLLHGELQRRRIALESDMADGLPDVSIDSVQIQQLLLNLVANALDAMEAEPGRFHVLRIRTSLDEPGGVRVAVRDTGVGLPPGQQEIFDAPNDADGLRREGPGLGLSISRSIVEAHGGHLGVTANADAGVTFHFTLPPAEETPGREGG